MSFGDSLNTATNEFVFVVNLFNALFIQPRTLS